MQRKTPAEKASAQPTMDGLVLREALEPEEEQGHAGGTECGKRAVDDVREPARRLAGPHQNRDGDRVERFVQHNGQEGAKAQESRIAVDRVDLHAGGQRHPVDQRVNPHSEHHADPAQPFGRMMLARASDREQ